jgi:hypothetical protein
MKVICDICPCFDLEYSRCNLGFAIEAFEWDEISEEDIDMISDNCKLEVIKYDGEEFRPVERK